MNFGNVTTTREGTWPLVGYTAQMAGPLQEPPEFSGRRLERNVVSALNDVIGGAYKDIRAGIPVRHKDGERSKVKLLEARVSTAGARTKTDSPRMVFLEKDTKAHVIVPVKARALRFVKRGKVIYAKRVNHPGTRGKHLWQRADAQVRMRLPRAIDAAVTAALNAGRYVRRWWRA